MTPLKGFLAFCCKPNASFATLAILTFLATNSLFSQQKIENTSPAMQERVKETLKKNGQSLRFMENKGQLSDDAILYYFEGLNGSVYIKADQAVNYGTVAQVMGEVRAAGIFSIGLITLPKAGQWVT